MDYLTSLFFIEISRMRGRAVDRGVEGEHRTERDGHLTGTRLWALVTRILGNNRSDRVSATTLP